MSLSFVALIEAILAHDIRKLLSDKIIGKLQFVLNADLEYNLCVFAHMSDIKCFTKA
jgi:hypothetical protein